MGLENLIVLRSKEVIRTEGSTWGGELGPKLGFPVGKAGTV